jgi:hypothetical protein
MRLQVLLYLLPERADGYMGGKVLELFRVARFWLRVIQTVIAKVNAP